VNNTKQQRPPGPIRTLTTSGLQFLVGLSADEASDVGQHWNAIRRYLEYGDDTELSRFDGVAVVGFELEADPDTIEWHAVRGDVRFESIYDEVV